MADTSSVTRRAVCILLAAWMPMPCQRAFIPVGTPFRVGGPAGLDILLRESDGRTFLSVRAAVPPEAEQVAIVRVAHRQTTEVYPRPVLRYTDLIIPLLPGLRSYMAPRHEALTFPAHEIAGLQVQILAIVSESKYGNFKP